ncbi:MAG: NifB/NifX family molybdenum-iron cluster-binding protein [Desulfatiglandaceae bacterium]|jgi:predicted Fe-Mo cluster-binding NifX family protein
MKIAIPIWEGKVSPVFDTASRLLILQVENKNETSRFETFLDEIDLTRRCMRIQSLGIETLICGAISGHFHRMLRADDVEVIPWISGAAEDVLKAYLDGNIFDSKFLMPGCHRQPDKTVKSQSASRLGKNDKVEG